MLGALRTLQDAGIVEIATSAATHGYLPLLSRDSSIYGQITTGVEAYERRFGREPNAIWLPECAYRPAYRRSTAMRSVRGRALESFLAEQGLEVFFSETHTVEGGRPVGKAAGEAIGPYGAVPRRYKVTVTEDSAVGPGHDLPGLLGRRRPGTGRGAGRNNRTGQQVWSGTYGYPGRLLVSRVPSQGRVSGMQYWRIGGAGVDLGEKPLYRAGARRRSGSSTMLRTSRTWSRSCYRLRERDWQIRHHLVRIRHRALRPLVVRGRGLAQAGPRAPVRSDVVELTTASRIIDEHAPARVLALPESSWGAGGGHFTWLNADTEWMWPVIHKAERHMEELVAAYPDADRHPARRAQPGRARAPAP